MNRSNKSNLILLLLPTLMAASLYYAVITPSRFGAYHDDGIYVSTAKALAEGDGYRIICLPGAPAQTKYPPLYPVLLSLVWRAYSQFPENLTPMTLLSVFATMGFLAVTWRYLLSHEYAGELQVIAIIAMTALNWRTAILSTSIYSEMLYAALSVGALHIAERHENARHTRVTGLALGVLIGLAFLTRSSGVALLVAVAVYCVLKRKWRKALLPVGLGALFVVGWVVWGYRNKTPADGLNVAYYTSYLGHLNQVVNDLRAQSGSSTFGVFAQIAIENLVGGILISVPLVCSGLSYDSFAELTGYALAAALCATFLIIILIAIGFIRALWKQVRLLHIYVAACLGLYLFWLPDVSYDRFLMPLLPFLLLFLVCEISLLASLASEALRATGAVRKASATLIVLVLLVVAGTTIYGYSSGAYSMLASLRTSATRAAEDDQAMDWINSHTDPSEVLVCYRDPKYFLYTRHKAVRSLPMTAGFSWEEDTASMDKLAQAIFRIIDEADARYLVVTSTDFELEDRPEQHRQTFNKLIQQHAEVFIPVFESTSGTSRVYRITRNAS